MNNSIRLKLFISFILGLSGALFMTYAAWNVSIQANIDSFVQFIDRIVFSATTLAQRNALTNPEIGSVIYNSDLKVHQAWNGQHWYNLWSACPMITELQVHSIQEWSYGWTTYGADTYNMQTLDWYVGINGIEYYISIDNITIQDNNILGPTQAVSYVRSFGSISIEDLGIRGRTIIGWTIDIDAQTATIQLCGTIGWANLKINIGKAGPALVGENSQVQISRENNGTEIAENIVLQISFPDRLNVTDTDGGTQSDSTDTTTISWNIGDLESDSEDSRSITIQPTQAQRTNIQVQISSDTPETSLSDNSGSIWVMVTQGWVAGYCMMSPAMTCNSGTAPAMQCMAGTMWPCMPWTPLPPAPTWTWVAGYCMMSPAMTCNSGTAPAMQCMAGTMWPCMPWTPLPPAPTWTGIDIQFSTPTNPWSALLWSNLTWSIYISELSGNNAENIVITATVPSWYPYASVVGGNADSYLWDGMMNPIIATRNIWTAYTWGPFSIVLTNSSWQTGTIHTQRNITTSSNDTNTSNNSYSMPFTRY